MTTGRTEAFSDGVIAIIITIMVLELRVPADVHAAALLRLTPIFLSYVLSFLVVAIMWVNHHHMLHTAKHADAKLLWANNFLLFWMSLIPFSTAYLGTHYQDAIAVALYGAVLALAGLSFTILRIVIDWQHEKSRVRNAQNRRYLQKSILAAGLYASSAPLAFVDTRISFFIFVLIPALFFLPGRFTLTDLSEDSPSPESPAGPGGI